MPPGWKLGLGARSRCRDVLRRWTTRAPGPVTPSIGAPSRFLSGSDLRPERADGGAGLTCRSGCAGRNDGVDPVRDAVHVRDREALGGAAVHEGVEERRPGTDPPDPGAHEAEARHPARELCGEAPCDLARVSPQVTGALDDHGAA